MRLFRRPYGANDAIITSTTETRRVLFACSPMPPAAGIFPPTVRKNTCYLDNDDVLAARAACSRGDWRAAYERSAARAKPRSWTPMTCPLRHDRVAVGVRQGVDPAVRRGFQPADRRGQPQKAAMKAAEVALQWFNGGDWTITRVVAESCTPVGRKDHPRIRLWRTCCTWIRRCRSARAGSRTVQRRRRSWRNSSVRSAHPG